MCILPKIIDFRGALLYNVGSLNQGCYMSKVKDLKGQKFNMMTAVRMIGNDTRGAKIWLFKCDCGKEKELRGSQVSSGRVKSCGCLQDRTSHGMSSSHEYKIWSGMKQRCLNPKAPDYKQYGERGITICDRWIESFENFFEDVGEIPLDKEIDRIDNNGNYEPSNIRLASREFQMQNMSKSKVWIVNGVEYPSQRKASKETGISASQINRMCNGYTHANGKSHPPKDGCYTELRYKD